MNGLVDHARSTREDGRALDRATSARPTRAAGCKRAKRPMAGGPYSPVAAGRPRVRGPEVPETAGTMSAPPRVAAGRFLAAILADLLRCKGRAPNLRAAASAAAFPRAPRDARPRAAARRSSCRAARAWRAPSRPRRMKPPMNGWSCMPSYRFAERKHSVRSPGRRLGGSDSGAWTPRMPQEVFAWLDWADRLPPVGQCLSGGELTEASPTEAGVGAAECRTAPADTDQVLTPGGAHLLAPRALPRSAIRFAASSTPAVTRRPVRCRTAGATRSCSEAQKVSRTNAPCTRGREFLLALPSEVSRSQRSTA